MVPNHGKKGVMMRGCNPSTQKVEAAGGGGVCQKFMLSHKPDDLTFLPEIRKAGCSLRHRKETVTCLNDLEDVL